MNSLKEKLILDAATGTGLAIINDWGILIVNAIIILGRVALELLIYQKEKRKREAEEKEKKQ